MIRIGFDPGLDADLHNREIVQMAEQSRQLREAFPCMQKKVHLTSIFLAWIGRRMTALGANLEYRYGGKGDQYRDMQMEYEDSECPS